MNDDRATDHESTDWDKSRRELSFEVQIETAWCAPPHRSARLADEDLIGKDRWCDKVQVCTFVANGQDLCGHDADGSPKEAPREDVL